VLAPYWATITRYKRRRHKILLLLFGGHGLMWSNVQGYGRGVGTVAAFLGSGIMISFSDKMSNAGLDRPMQALVINRMGLR
jgi:hypothetical protein